MNTNEQTPAPRRKRASAFMALSAALAAPAMQGFDIHARRIEDGFGDRLAEPPGGGAELAAWRRDPWSSMPPIPRTSLAKPSRASVLARCLFVPVASLDAHLRSYGHRGMTWEFHGHAHAVTFLGEQPPRVRGRDWIQWMNADMVAYGARIWRAR